MDACAVRLRDARSQQRLRVDEVSDHNRNHVILYFVAGGLIRAKGVANRYEQIVTLLDGRGRSGPDEWADAALPLAARNDL